MVVPIITDNENKVEKVRKLLVKEGYEIVYVFMAMA